jgi:hypothetical protein
VEVRPVMNYDAVSGGDARQSAAAQT